MSLYFYLVLIYEIYKVKSEVLLEVLNSACKYYYILQTFNLQSIKCSKLFHLVFLKLIYSIFLQILQLSDIINITFPHTKKYHKSNKFINMVILKFS